LNKGGLIATNRPFFHASDSSGAWFFLLLAKQNFNLAHVFFLTLQPISERAGLEIKNLEIMKRALTFLFLLSASVGCKDKEYVNPEVQATPCVSNYKDTRRQSYESLNEAGMVIGGFIYPLLPSDSPPYDFSLRTAAIPCNLPQKFRKDGLIVSFSGYYLTSPLLELIQISAIPFELTDIKLRE